jgi:hypothetical protein
MWEPRCLTTLWAFTACYRGSFTFVPFTNWISVSSPFCLSVEIDPVSKTLRYVMEYWHGQSRKPSATLIVIYHHQTPLWLNYKTAARQINFWVYTHGEFCTWFSTCPEAFRPRMLMCFWRVCTWTDPAISMMCNVPMLGEQCRWRFCEHILCGRYRFQYIMNMIHGAFPSFLMSL